VSSAPLLAAVVQAVGDVFPEQYPGLIDYNGDRAVAGSVLQLPARRPVCLSPLFNLRLPLAADAAAVSRQQDHRSKPTTMLHAMQIAAANAN